MTTTPETEASVDVPYADGVLSGRVMSAGVFLAGLVANGMLETVGRPDKLAQYLFPGEDPAVVQRIFELGVAAGLHAGQVSRNPWLYRDQLARAQAELEAIGFEAMARLVARSRRLVAPHPADGESARARELRCDKRTNDTGEGGQDR